MRFRPLYIRDRLTLWYIGVFAIVLVIYVCGAVALFTWQLTKQVYHAEIQDVETAEALLYVSRDGRVSMHVDYHNHPAHRLLFDRLLEVLTPDGVVLYRNQKLQGRALGGPPFPGEGQASYNERSLRLSDGTRVLAISHVHAIEGKPLLIRLAYSIGPVVDQVTEFLAFLLLALPIPLVISAFAGRRMAGKVLNPLEQMTRQTERIRASHLDERVPVDNPDDELGHLASVLNNLLGRLQESFEKMKSFTSDASHELRTPLASIRSVGEVALQREHTSEDYRNAIGSMLEEVMRLTRLVDTLLIISRADNGQIEVHRTHVSLSDLLRESVSLIGVLADEKHQSISFHGGDGVMVFADRSLLRQALINIIENAVKYSPDGSQICLRLNDKFRTAADAPVVELVIEDEGPGISTADGERIFERFYRLDEKRSIHSGGLGLGLAIAKWAVEANDGEIGFRPGKRKGSEFFIRLKQVR